MPLVLDDLHKLIQQHEQVTKEEAELSGRLKEALKTLKEDFNVNSVDELRELVKKLVKQRQKLVDEYTEKYNQFKKAFEKYQQQKHMVK